MNLHRASKKPDWEAVSPSSRNTFQKVAALTYGFVSPANIITVIGLGLVVVGLIEILREQYFLGLVLVAVGRLFDVADGLVAEITKTKSWVGEVFDAAADKIGTLLTIIVIFLAGITNWWVIAALLIPQVVIPLVIFYKKQKGIAVHPTRSGKFSMATTWLGIVGLFIVKAMDGYVPVTIAVYFMIGISLALGLYALWQYSTGRD